MDISSETDQQEYLIDISNEEEQVKDAQDDFKDTFLRNTGVSLNTLSDLRRSDLPGDGMFTREIEPKYFIGFNKNVWEQLVSQHLNANRSRFKYGTRQSPFIVILKKINPYCSIMFKRHRVMLPKFRKSRTSIIFRAEGYCKHSSCTLKKIRVKLTEDLIVSMEFEGTTIRHKVGETQARPIQGIERQK